MLMKVMMLLIGPNDNVNDNIEDDINTDDSDNCMELTTVGNYNNC